MSTPRVDSFRFERAPVSDALLPRAVYLHEVRDGDGALLWVCRAVARCMVGATAFRDVEHGPVRYRMHPSWWLFNRTWRLFDPERTTPFAAVTAGGGGALWRLLDVRGSEQARIVEAASVSPAAAAAGVPFVLAREGAVAGHMRERGGAWLLELAPDSDGLDPRLLVAAMVLLQERTLGRRHRPTGAR